LNKARVLLLDDEKELVDVMKERLELSGYIVTACYDINNAIEKAQSEKFDVAVLDLIMPDTDGITAMIKLKMIRPLMECLVLSGQGTLKMAVESMKQGAFDFLEKPCDHEIVKEKIDQAFARKQEQDKRIIKAAGKVFTKLENAIVGVTFAEAGQFDTAQEMMKK